MESHRSFSKVWPLLKEAHKESKTANIFYEEMKPLLFGLRILGRIFYQNNNGTLEWKYFSSGALIWLVVYSTNTFFAIQILTVVFDSLRAEQRFEFKIKWSINLIIMTYHFIGPFSVLIETSRICSYFNEWKKFQNKFLIVFGKQFTPCYKRWMRISYLSMPVTVLVMVFFERTILYNSNWKHLVVYFAMFSSAQINVILWVFSLLEIGAIGIKINDAIHSIMKNSGKRCYASDLYMLRKLWFSLSHIVQSLSHATVLSMLVMILIDHVTFIAAMYGFLVNLFGGGPSTLLFLAVIIISVINMMLLLETGQFASNKVGKHLSETLCNLDLTKIDFLTAREVELFIASIQSHTPEITFGGFVHTNRATLTKMLGSTVTYLIVLIQFYANSQHT